MTCRAEELSTCRYGMWTCIWADGHDPPVCANCDEADSYEPDEDLLMPCPRELAFEIPRGSWEPSPGDTVFVTDRHFGRYIDRGVVTVIIPGRDGDLPLAQVRAQLGDPPRTMRAFFTFDELRPIEDRP
jgi:hypothetical protein